MIADQQLVDYMFRYERYIKIGNDLLRRHFKVVGCPLLAKRQDKIPMQGEVESEGFSFSFHFHGMGCLFKFGKTIVDFDYSFGDFIYKGFESRKLFLFIESSSNDEVLKEDVDRSIRRLEFKGVLLRKDESSIDTYEYQLNKDMM